ncbi:MAG: MBL fold metallo-hydrolase [Phycisphaerales bacterium]
MRDCSFIFLGTGTSGGIPLIACDCAVCTSDDPRDTRSRSGACVTWIDDTGRRRVVLIDATPDLRAQAVRHDLWRCDAVFFTHNHVDHIFGLDEVRRFNHAMGGEPIDIYAEDYTLAALRRVYKHVFDAQDNVNKSFVATLIAHELREGVHVDLHGMRFTPIRLLHGRLPIFGFRIEPTRAEAGPPLALAYCTDTSAIPTQTWAMLEGLETLVLDGLRHRHHPTHFTIDQACDAALQVGAAQTYLTHIAHEVHHARVDAELPEGIALSYDGLVLGAALPERLG